MSYAALNIDLIVREILQWLPSIAPDQYDLPDGKADLARCARVSRAFSDNALNLLWRYLSGQNLLAWLRLLPSSLKIARKFESGFDSYFLAPTILPNEWTRFMYYSRRIRLFWMSFNSEKVDISVCSVLVEHANGIPLLPNLVSVSWDIEPASFPSNTDFLRLFLSHTTREVMIVFNTEAEDDFPPPSLDTGSLDFNVMSNNIFYSLGTYATNIESLSVQGADWVPHCLRHIGRMQTLRDLHMHIPEIHPIPDSNSYTIDWELLSNLTSLLNLSDLGLDLPNLVGDPSSMNLVFKHIQTLKVATFDPDIAQRFFRAISAPDIHFLNLCLEEVPAVHWTPCREVVEAIATTFAPTLRSVKIQLPLDLDDPEDSQLPCMTDIMGPLLELPDIDEVTVVAYRSWQLTSDDLHNIATSWQHLVSLNLMDTSASGTELPFVSSLIHFTRHCPDLRTLYLDTVFLDKELLDPMPLTSDAPEHNLSSLYIRSVCYSVSYHPAPLPKVMEGLARYLDRLFPNLLVEEHKPTPSGPDFTSINPELVECSWHSVAEALALVKQSRRMNEPETSSQSD